MRRDQETSNGTGPIPQNAVRVLLRRILQPPGCTGLHEVHWRNEAGREDHTDGSRPRLPRRQAVWVSQEAKASPQVMLTDGFRRGKSGGQVRDEYRDEYDPGRGGYGRAIAEERLKEEEEYGRGR